MPRPQPSDQGVRDKVTGDLGVTFLLEAGAGTGKTSVLVERYVSCVLAPDLGTGDVRTVAAITFTEKAAGELRQRIRERFEQIATEAPAGSPRAVRAGEALDALDDAPIGTIHSFSGRLLREFPVEAGVDPAFEQLDPLAADLELGRLWDEWLTEVAAGEAAWQPLRERLTRLLRAGVRLDHVRTLALGPNGVFGERYDIDPIGEPAAAPDLTAGLAGLAASVAWLRDHCVAACTNESDRGFCCSMDLVDLLEPLLADPPDELDQLAAALYALPLKTGVTGPGGSKTNWQPGGKDELLARYQALAAAVAALCDSYATYLAGLALSVADGFARWAAEQLASLGRLDFTDLLGRLRDMLACDLDVRARLQERFRFVLVDEFQDTDPLQAEIVFLLCEREAKAADWREVVLEPGKLFVVGDPKQSIYRFRRADITLYDEVKELVAGQPDRAGALERITQNFRTTPAILAWVNNVFADVFGSDQEPGRQPDYTWVDPFRPAAGGASVALLVGREYGGAGDNPVARADEAAALAALLLEMHADEERWSVCDRERSSSGVEVPRPARWGDVAILFRSTTGLETYEQALREAGVPFRAEGGSMYFSRREVADVLLCLRAVDDPSDGPAVYGALHSSLFGFSDDDLFLFSAAGGRFDPFARQPAGQEAIAAALGALRDLHLRRAACESHELVEEIVRVSRSFEFQAAVGAGGAQGIANLEKLVERARAFSAAGGGGLGAFLKWAEQAGDAAGEAESQVDDAADVVRLITIHKAKGLEYPIVILAGAALPAGGGRGEPIVDRHARRLVARLKADLPGASGCELKPADYVTLDQRETQMSRSEDRRLLYVATTRARDRLVVSCFGKTRNKDGGEPAGVLLGAIADTLPDPGSVTESHEEDGVLLLAPGEPAARAERPAPPDAEALVAARGAWQAAREELLERARRPMAATSPSGLEQVDEAAHEGAAEVIPGRGAALILGSVVHAVMELCDLDDEESLPELAAHAAAAEGRPDLAGRAAELAGACWRSPAVRAAAAAEQAASSAGTDAAGGAHRELSVGAAVDGVLVQGAVDMLYRDADGWVVVDYKTDRAADPEVLLARYRPQGAAYALAVEAALEEPVRRVVFVAAAAGREIVVPVDDALREEARRRIAEVAGGGRPAPA